jgi:hypothetical protein
MRLVGAAPHGLGSRPSSPTSAAWFLLPVGGRIRATSLEVNACTDLEGWVQWKVLSDPGFEFLSSQSGMFLARGRSDCLRASSGPAP